LIGQSKIGMLAAIPVGWTEGAPGAENQEAHAKAREIDEIR
jgi:hypothetical protein